VATEIREWPLMVRILLLLARRGGPTLLSGRPRADVKTSVNPVCDRIRPTAWRSGGMMRAQTSSAAGFSNGEENAQARPKPILAGHPPPDAYAVSFRVRLWRQISPNCCRKRQ